MSLREELKLILGQIHIDSPAAFRFQGEPRVVNQAVVTSVPGLPSHPLPGVPLVRDMQGLLYERCYSRRLGEAPPEPLEGRTPDPTFVQKLSAANRSRTTWEGGWNIYQISANGQVWLMKGDRQRAALPGEFVGTAAPGVPVQPGSAVQVQAVRESVAAQPGFYFMYGETLGDQWDDANLVRFYFHATPDGVAPLIEQLTGRLNRYQVPYRMKALSDPMLYGRTDSMVLYVARRYHGIVIRIVRDLPSEVTAALEGSTPLFSEQLQPGIGVAEDPNSGESFGMHRCRLVAEGIFNAWQKGDQSTDGRLHAIAEVFEQNGLVLDQAHLGPASVELTIPLTEVSFAHV